MDYLSEYRSKLRTPEEAAKAVKSGDWVEYGCGVTYTTLCDRALAARRDELRDCLLYTSQPVAGLLRDRAAVFVEPDIDGAGIRDFQHQPGPPYQLAAYPAIPLLRQLLAGVYGVLQSVCHDYGQLRLVNRQMCIRDSRL